MADNKQTQKAGENSQQIQANTIIVNQGIDEKRAREICAETLRLQNVILLRKQWLVQRKECNN